MARLPVLSGRQAVTAFERAGFRIDRRHGSHSIMIKAGHPYSLSVPDHRELAPGTLRALIRKAGLATQEFLRLL